MHSVAQPSCCIEKGIYWDEAIVYPRGPRWKDQASPLTGMALLSGLFRAWIACLMNNTKDDGEISN